MLKRCFSPDDSHKGCRPPTPHYNDTLHIEGDLSSFFFLFRLTCVYEGASCLLGNEGRRQIDTRGFCARIKLRFDGNQVIWKKPAHRLRQMYKQQIHAKNIYTGYTFMLTILLKHSRFFIVFARNLVTWTCYRHARPIVESKRIMAKDSFCPHLEISNNPRTIYRNMQLLCKLVSPKQYVCYKYILNIT